VAVIGGLVVLLALRGVGADPAAPWWSAGTVLASAGLAAALAVRERREAWAFVAGLGVNLAASLVVWHANQGAPLSDWWTALAQANVVATALTTFAWVAASRLIDGVRRPAVGAAPLLNLQVVLLLLGNVLLLAVSGFLLVLRPK